MNFCTPRIALRRLERDLNLQELRLQEQTRTYPIFCV
jgi:hypothetical protein